MDDYIVPRCKSCGDALVSDDPNATMIVCRSCGNINQRSDAMAALEQAKCELMSWIRTAIPAGVDVNATANIDPIARHNIFVNSVKPKIDAEFRDYKFGFTNILSNPLMAMPFKVVNNITVKHPAKDLFGFDAKVKSIESLAVDDESKALVSTSGAISYAYAMMINNINLLAKPDSDRYGFMENNFTLSANALADIAEYAVVVQRFKGLALISRGVLNLVNKKVADALSSLNEGKSYLQSAMVAAGSSIEFGSMSIAIKKEISYADSIVKIAEAMASAPDFDSNQLLKVVGGIIDGMNSQEARLGSDWSVLMKRSERFADIFTELGHIIDSKTGRASLRTLSVNGGVLLPFWHVDVTYSFTTGSLFKKKSVRVTEDLLISASFLTSNPSDAASTITDIFAGMPQAKLMDRVSGKESSLSASSGVSKLLSKIGDGYTNNIGVIVPISTRQEAEKQANDYLNQIKASHPQLSMGAASVKGLIYLPYTGIDGQPAEDLKNSGIDVARLPHVLGSADTMKDLVL